MTQITTIYSPNLHIPVFWFKVVENGEGLIHSDYGSFCIYGFFN